MLFFYLYLQKYLIISDIDQAKFKAIMATDLLETEKLSTTPNITNHLIKTWGKTTAGFDGTSLNKAWNISRNAVVKSNFRVKLVSEYKFFAM